MTFRCILLIWSILTFFLGTTCLAQNSKHKLFFEAGGSGGLASFNYEHWFPPSTRPHTGWDGDDGISKFQFTFRGGIGLSPIDKNNGWVIVLPAMFNCIYGKHTSAHRLEFGAGIAPSITTTLGGAYIKSPLMFGYRFAPKDKRIFLRADYTPIFGWLVDVQWQHWFGVSVGYTLKEKE